MLKSLQDKLQKQIANMDFSFRNFEQKENGRSHRLHCPKLKDEMQKQIPSHPR
jgi:hypothetical protein